MAHAINAQIKVQFHAPCMPDDEREVAYPTVRIRYEYAAGRPAYTPRGEYAPIDPPEPPELEMIEARLIDGDGLDPTQQQVNEWAETWLYDEGFHKACDVAERDLSLECFD